MTRMRFCSVCILAAASLILLSSCSKKKTIGSPYILYEIHGIVTDDGGTPLKGISVYSGNSEADVTSSKGEFVIFGRSAPSEYAEVVCEDPDGTENGVSFMKTTVSVKMRLRSAGNGNNMGNYFASEVVVRMLLKDDGMQDDMNPPIPS